MHLCGKATLLLIYKFVLWVPCTINANYNNVLGSVLLPLILMMFTTFLIVGYECQHVDNAGDLAAGSIAAVLNGKDVRDYYNVTARGR